MSAPLADRIDLSIAVDGVTISNSGDGNVTVNGDKVNQGDNIVIEHPTVSVTKPDVFTVGEAQEYTVSTTGGSKTGTMVKGYFKADNANIAKIDPRKMDSKALRQSAKTTIPLETDLTAFHIENADSQTDKITTIPIATQEVPEHYLDQSSQNLSEKELEPALATIEASAEDTESPSKLDQVTPTKKKVSKNLLNMLKRFSKGK